MGPGTELDGGKYRIVRPLGSGGMGAVYEALNTRTRKRVAIKCLLPSLARSSPNATERLMREAEASCRVRHPNVVDVYDIVRDGHDVFLVMEYLEGEPLTATLERGDLPMYRLITLLLPAMRAVAAAHAQGVVHRDIKPDNIFLARHADVADPVPKVLDFGISKLEARGTKHASLTRAGAAIGTPMYMSYEQLLGADDVDGRADVYAFGVVLYEALTGRPPYEARSHAEWLLHFAVPPASPKTHRPEIPTALDRLVMWCLESDRDKRVPSMEALIRELEPFAIELSFRNLLTMPSQASVLLSKIGPTPTEAVAALLERIQASNTPKPPAAAPTPAGRVREAATPSQAASLSASAEFVRALGNPRSWLIAGGAALLAVIAAIYFWRGDPQVPEPQQETTVNAATAPLAPAKAVPTSAPLIAAPPAGARAGAVNAAVQPKAAEESTPAAARDGSERRPQSQPAASPESQVAPVPRVNTSKAVSPQPPAATERPARSGNDWGIY